MLKYLLLIRFVFPSFLSVFYLRLLGFKIGVNVKISPFCLIFADKIEIGNNSELRSFVFIKCEKFKVGRNTIISYGVQIKGEKSFVTGDNCFVGTQSILHCDEDINLGFYSAIGIKNLIYTHSSFLPASMGYPVKFKPISIGDFVWLSMNVSVLAGAEIGSNCIIGPGVVINSVISNHTIIEQNTSSYKIFKKENFQNLLKNKVEILFSDFFCSFLKSKDIQYVTCDNIIEFSYNKISYKYFLNSLEGKFLVIFSNLSGNVISCYDFDNFYCDNHNSKLHKDLLFFLRRQYGITLRTNYND